MVLHYLNTKMVFHYLAHPPFPDDHTHHPATQTKQSRETSNQLVNAADGGWQATSCSVVPWCLPQGGSTDSINNRQ